MTHDEHDLRIHPLEPEELEKILDDIKRAPWIEGFAWIGGLTTLLALAALACATAFLLQDRNRAFSQQVQGLATPMTQIKSQATKLTQTVQNLEKQKSDANSQLKVVRNELEGLKKRLKETETLDTLSATLAKAETKNESLQADIYALRTDNDSLRTDNDSLRAAYESLCWGADVLYQLKNHADAECVSLRQKLKTLDSELSQRQTAIQDSEWYSRDPDPSLATLVVLVYGEMNFSFLQADLLDSYIYLNYRKPKSGRLSIDVARGSALLQTPKMTHVPEHRQNIDLNELREFLEFSRQGVPRPDTFPESLPRYFNGVDETRKQLILIVGAECPVATIEKWKAFEHPVHICVVGDGRRIDPNKEINWREFATAKRGHFLFQEVNLDDLTSRSFVSEEIRSWLEDRLRRSLSPSNSGN